MGTREKRQQFGEKPQNFTEKIASIFFKQIFFTND
jgi:hypothetical protein